ncbi:non-ribosomal peptide synthetase [Nocardia transvalensis]|uniref:non-ribosomal peptide synthetase n=1 Tax=Nocardia transvalensis TaxID=37333 RepID=UPI0018951CB3|nr:non-ribosomal peptide synthetase [Nocardia transvalensis]MBF6330403.1 amino acid adenylation domain-containing protein [Nocardia transvalensis]
MTPLSFAQQRLWFLHEMGGPSPAYNVPVALRISGDLDRAALRAAVQDVVDRHESLRTVIATEAGQPYQVLLDVDRARLPWEHRSVDEADLSDELGETARHTFDLTSDLPVRATLFETGPGQHVLLIVMHHIASDGWSVGPLLRDIGTAFEARRCGRAPDWAPLPLQYADYAEWQRDVLGDAGDPDSLAAQQLSYWKKQLAGLPEQLDLPTDRPRPAVASHRGGYATLWLEPPLHQALIESARGHRASLFMVLQAALAALFARLGAGEDIAIGAPIAGRTDDLLNDLIGLFVNNLVIRSDVSGNPTFTELVARVRETALAAYEHQDVPFEYLVDELNPTRSLARHPLFQVMLALQNAPDMIPCRLAGLDTQLIPVPALTGTTKFDLGFGVWEYGTYASPEGLQIVAEYATDLFAPTTVELLLQRLRRFLEGVVVHPDRSVSRIDILGADEYRTLVTEWSRNRHGITEATIPQLFESQVRRTPDATAVVYGDISLSYRELDVRANRLAHALLARAVAPDQIVATAVPRGIELPVTVLAVLKAGAAYLPIDLEYPRERIEFMLADARPTVVLVTTETASVISGAETVPRLVIDDPDAVDFGSGRADDPTDADRVVPLHPQHCAYVMYTSGSTGTPKAVATTHIGIASQITAQVTRLNVTAQSRVLQFASPSFDVSLWELCMALMSGGTVFLADAATLAPGAPLMRFVEERRITHVTLPPSVLAALPPGSESSPTMTTMVLAAEGPSRELIVRWARGRHIINAYGATENTMCATMSEPLAETIEGEPPIGRPNINSEVYVLGSGLQPVPCGVIGELYIAGLGLSRGYHRRPGQTAERFVACPFGPPGRRMYRTGDLARWRADGNLECLGRVDDQINMRGFRIEPREIESLLVQHPDVVRAVVRTRAEQPGDIRLVAYVVPARPGCRPTTVREYARSRLPKHMVPAAVVLVQSFPLTPNGKLDWDALPPPTYDDTATGARARTPQEQTLAELFAEVLGRTTVGVDDNFFDLGGHSLLATQLIEKIRITLDADIGVAALFEAPTPAGLAGRLGIDDGDRAFDVILPLRSASGGPALFCVHPVGGLSWPYAGLMKHLDRDVSLFGIQARGLSRPERLPESVEQMALDYLDHIRSVRPAGPYNLLGWSFGGIVAHSMAVELQRRGESVDALFLLDAHPQWHPSDDGAVDERLLLARVLEIFDCDTDGLTDRSLTPLAALNVVRSRGGPHALASLSERHLTSMAEVLTNNTTLMQGYTPAVYEGDVVHFTAVRAQSNDDPAAEIWRPYVEGHIETIPVDCAHDDMTRPEPLARIGSVVAEKLQRIRIP